MSTNPSATASSAVYAFPLAIDSIEPFNLLVRPVLTTDLNRVKAESIRSVRYAVSFGSIGFIHEPASL